MQPMESNYIETPDTISETLLPSKNELIERFENGKKIIDILDNEDVDDHNSDIEDEDDETNKKHHRHHNHHFNANENGGIAMSKPIEHVLQMMTTDLVLVETNPPTTTTTTTTTTTEPTTTPVPISK